MLRLPSEFVIPEVSIMRASERTNLAQRQMRRSLPKRTGAKLVLELGARDGAFNKPTPLISACSLSTMYQPGTEPSETGISRPIGSRGASVLGVNNGLPRLRQHASQLPVPLFGRGIVQSFATRAFRVFRGFSHCMTLHVLFLVSSRTVDDL